MVNFWLPEDLIVEILSRLPVKTLLRFKCVCTQWSALMSSPLFASLHLESSISNPTRHSIIVYDHCLNKAISLHPITFSPVENINLGLDHGYRFFPGIGYVGSINGLICEIGYSLYCLFLWNPSTRLFKRLPPGRHTDTILNPSNCSFGFGWDPIANDYKVVKIVSIFEDGKIRTWAEVWSSNLDSWREIKVNRNFILRRVVCDVIVNGFPHWIVYDGIELDSKLLVASFDTRTEVLHVVPVPELLLQLVPTTKQCAYFGMNWKGSFCLAGRVSVKPKKIYQVWKMENDSVTGKEAWTKKFTFALDVEFSGFLYNINEKFVLERYGELISYDVETREINTVGIEEAKHLVFWSHYYVESLVSIKGFNPFERWI
ncbi:F-box/kelch-repeat protein [Abeliophyllum distichum]|uniref:F-box/kelch-repeat protein n=1 Tax=Abeliophyllum distichum TaxID=126358 RepID=A0ABD1SC54_9LAMI